MQRVLELVNEVRSRHPEDPFFSNFESSCVERRLKRDFYNSYETALRCLDEEAWRMLKSKAIDHFLDHRPGQLKTGFFNHLNEAFAYRYLISHGYNNVGFLPEKKNSKQPDLSFMLKETPGFCEVKSIGISDDEIGRRDSHECTDGSVYANLSAEFMNKLQSTIARAETQISEMRESSIIFIVIEFDDFTHDYLAEYRKQLHEFISANPFSNLILQVGRFGEAINA